MNSPLTRRELLQRATILGVTAAAVKAGAKTKLSDFSDWANYPDGDLSFSKSLPHNSLGAVDPQAFRTLNSAVDLRNPATFEQVLLGGSLKLANPQGAFVHDPVIDPSSDALLGPPPLFHSEEQAGELVELAWQALARDVYFADYSSHPIIHDACAELSSLADFKGPRLQGKVAAQTVFRGNTPGDLAGPYISQFLLKDFQYGAITVSQRFAVPRPELDHLTIFSRWLAAQNGEVLGGSPYGPFPRYDLETGTRFIRNGRDLAEFVHRDFSYQAYLSTALILLGMKAPFDKGNPYRKSKTQAGFCTFGEAHLFELLAQAASLACKAAWHQKWAVYMRLRPEEFGGRAHLYLTGAVNFPIAPSLRQSEAMRRLYAANGTFLLPQAYPEGCPTHPSYPAGHASIAGACSTVLKAFFDETFEIREPVMASRDGLQLLPCAGVDLRVGGELDKLAFNVAMGRNFAGIHWRSDAAHGLWLGEQVGLSILAAMRATVNEPYKLSVTKFDGQTIQV